MRSNLRAIGRSTVYHLVNPPQRPNVLDSVSIRRPHGLPTSPSCSRWFSCTHAQCHPTSGHFFSSAQYSTSHPHESRRPPNSARYPSMDTEDELTSQRRPEGPNLPIPPSLPYSPNSVPFKRHLELLSHSLSLDPDTSWETYSALHPSLRRFVSNRVYRKLVQHQTEGDEGGSRWERIEELLVFAKKCGMELEELGSRNIIAALDNGLAYYSSLSFKKVRKLELEDMVMMDLWNMLNRWHKRDLSRIPLQTRSLWLKMHFARTQKLGNTMKADERYRAARSALDHLIEGGAIHGLGEEATKIVLQPKVQGTEQYIDDIRRLIRIMQQGTDIPWNTFFAIMGRFRARCGKDGSDGYAKLEELVTLLCAEIGDETEVEDIHNRLTHSLLEIGHRYIPLADKATVLLQEADPKTRKMLRLVKRIVNRHNSQNDVNLAIRVAISLFERIAYRRLVDPQAFILYLLPAMFKLRREAVVDTTPHILRLADIFLAADLLPHIDQNFIHMLMFLLAKIPNETAFLHARRVYNYARATEPPFSWKSYDYNVWRLFLRRALARGSDEKRHLHFASRLYADAIADGVPIRQSEALHLIRIISSTSSQGRLVLITRHLKDYQYFGYGSYEQFVMSVVDGLTSTRRARDAWLAFHLAMRVRGPVAVPTTAISKILDILMNTGRLITYRQCGIILEYLSASSATETQWARLIKEVLNGDLKKDNLDRTKRPSRRNRLALAIQLYRAMLAKGVHPTPAIIGVLTQGIVEYELVDKAIKIADSLVEQNQVLPLFAIRSILLELRIQGRYTEADRILEDYRGVLERNRIYQAAWADTADIGAEAILRRIRGTTRDEISQMYGEKIAEEAETGYGRWNKVKFLQEEAKARYEQHQLEKAGAMMSSEHQTGDQTREDGNGEKEVISDDNLDSAFLGDSPAVGSPHAKMDEDHGLLEREVVDSRGNEKHRSI